MIGTGALFRVVLDEFKERFRVLRRADAAQQAGRAHGQRHDLGNLRGLFDHLPQARAGALVPHQRQREGVVVGVNFNAYFLLLMRRFRRAAASEEVRAYFLIIAVAVGIITCNIYSMYNSLGEALRQAAFQVGSIITTTGFSSCDFDLWPTLSKEILVMLMFVGACAGSTGGGMKVSRILILGKTLKKELKQALHPQVVAPVRMDGKLLNHETIRATNVYVAAYIFIFAASFLLISLDGFDMVTNFTAIAATLNNIGPGLNQVGPMMNFGSYSNPAKLVMIFDMLAGRLEIFPMLVFFLPDTWRRF